MADEAGLFYLVRSLGLLIFSDLFGCRASIPDHGNRSEAESSAKEVLEAARLNVTKNIFENVYTLKHPGVLSKKLNRTLITLDRINWLDECHILNLSKAADLSGIKGLGIQFNISFGKTYSVELKLSGSTMASRRKMEEDQFYSLGDKMMFSQEELKSRIYSLFVVKIKKFISVEEDPDNNCRNYPNADFQSFEDCDSKYMRKKVDEIAPKTDLTPPWLTDDLDKVTSKPVTLAANQLFPLGKLSACETSRIIILIDNADITFMLFCKGSISKCKEH